MRVLAKKVPFFVKEKKKVPFEIDMLNKIKGFNAKQV